MNRDREPASVALDTVAAAIEEFDAAAVGVDALAASVKSATLEEISDRRASVHKRIGATRAALVVLRGSIERQP